MRNILRNAMVAGVAATTLAAGCSTSPEHDPTASGDRAVTPLERAPYEIELNDVALSLTQRMADAYNDNPEAFTVTETDTDEYVIEAQDYGRYVSAEVQRNDNGVMEPTEDDLTVTFLGPRPRGGLVRTIIDGSEATVVSSVDSYNNRGDLSNTRTIIYDTDDINDESQGSDTNHFINWHYTTVDDDRWREESRPSERVAGDAINITVSAFDLVLGYR